MKLKNYVSFTHKTIEKMVKVLVKNVLTNTVANDGYKQK